MVFDSVYRTANSVLISGGIHFISSLWQFHIAHMKTHFKQPPVAFFQRQILLFCDWLAQQQGKTSQVGETPSDLWGNKSHPFLRFTLYFQVLL